MLNNVMVFAINGSEQLDISDLLIELTFNASLLFGFCFNIPEVIRFHTNTEFRESPRNEAIHKQVSGTTELLSLTSLYIPYNSTGKVCTH